MYGPLYHPACDYWLVNGPFSDLADSKKHIADSYSWDNDYPDGMDDFNGFVEGPLSYMCDSNGWVYGHQHDMDHAYGWVIGHLVVLNDGKDWCMFWRSSGPSI